jgi:tripartite-type tricarboxylate transporter receptor subunit TctC
MTQVTRRGAIAASLAALAAPAIAQPYTSRPVRLIIPFPPGNTADNLARLMAERLQAKTGATIVVENRTGASGALGVQAVTSSRPDGTTFLVTTQSPIVVSPPLTRNLPYDPIKDLAPVALFARNGFVLVVAPDFPARTMAELVAALRSKPPGHYIAANPGLGTMSHLAMELLNMQLGTRVEAVPYRGSAAALTDLSQGRVQLMIDGFVSAIPHAAGGQSRAIAVLAKQRAALIGDLPASAESGLQELADFDVQSWTGIFGPAGTPPEVTAYWNTQIGLVMAEPALISRFASQFVEAVVPASPERFASEIASDLAKWTRVARDAKIEPQ